MFRWYLKIPERTFSVLRDLSMDRGCFSTLDDDDPLSPAGVFMKMLLIYLLLSQYLFVMSVCFWNCMGWIEHFPISFFTYLLEKHLYFLQLYFSLCVFVCVCNYLLQIFSHAEFHGFLCALHDHRSLFFNSYTVGWSLRKDILLLTCPMVPCGTNY